MAPDTFKEKITLEDKSGIVELRTSEDTTCSGARQTKHGDSSADEPDIEKTDSYHTVNEEDEPAMQQVQLTATRASEKPYSAFTLKQKILIILCSTFGGLFSPFTTNIYFPALDTIASDLHVSISKVNLSITTYMIFQGITPTFISAITDTQGRRPTYVIGFLIYIAANIGLGVNNTYAGLMVLRCLQSCGSSGMVTLQQAIIADVVTSAERGRYIGITSMTSIIAPSVAPIVGGVLAQNLGWHSIFFFLLIMAGVYLVPMLLFMPETSRKLVGDGSILPPRWNMSLLNVWRSHKRRHGGGTEAHVPQERADRQKFTLPDPRPVFAIVAEKENFLLLFLAGIAAAGFYGISASLTVQFGQIYGLNSTFQGLLFLPQAVGSILAAITNSFLLDKIYRWFAIKHGVDPGKKKQIDLAGFPIEKARLCMALPAMAANSVFMIAYGWMLEKRVHIAGPIVILVLNAYTLITSFNGLGVLMIDINRHRAASASAAGNLIRCLLGAGMTAVINPMILAMGLGWCFTFNALIQALALPGMWACMQYGVKWRAEQAEKDTRKEAEKLEKKKAKEQAQ